MDFSVELAKARQVAEFALKHPNQTSSALVKHIGLNSVISCQILRKYGRDTKIKKVSNVNLIVPGQKIRNNPEKKTVSVTCLKLSLSYNFSGFTKINQMVVSKDYAYIYVTIPDSKPIKVESWIGLDRNATGACLVAANPTTGKVLKLGKKVAHVRNKYKKQRKKLQKLGKEKLVRRLNAREARIVRDLNHKISREVVEYAVKNKAGLVFEDLSGIREKKKRQNKIKGFKGAMNRWSFYQLMLFIEYKARLLGVPVVKIDPHYTSQQCSRCGLLGNRNAKKFECPHCGHVEDADVNAAFVIALRYQGILQLPVDRGAGKGSTDTPKEATA